MKKIKQYIAVLALCVTLAAPQNSHALFGVGDIVFDPGQTITSVIEFIRDAGVDAKQLYTDAEQLVYQYQDELHSIKSAVDDATKIAQLARQIDYMIEHKDLQGLANMMQEHSNLLQEMDIAKWMSINWDDFTINQFMRVIQILTEGDAIGIYVSEVDALFEEQYTGYSVYREEQWDSEMFGERYDHWSKLKRDTIKGALKTIGIQAEELSSEEELIIKLEEKTATAEGKMQVLQAAIELSAASIGQMQQMRELLMAQTQMHAAYYATQQDESDLMHAQEQKALLKEHEDGIVPITDDSTWEDRKFQMRVK
jgi:P-type conjugative transfer protein TrbJ